MKKLLKVTLVFIVALFVSTQVFAAEVASGDATMKLVKDEVAEETFGTYGWFQKKMTMSGGMLSTVQPSAALQRMPLSILRKIQGSL